MDKALDKKKFSDEKPQDNHKTHEVVYQVKKIDFNITNKGMLGRLKLSVLNKTRDTVYTNILKMLCDAESIPYKEVKNDSEVEIYKQGSHAQCESYVREFKSGKWSKAQDFWEEIKRKIMYVKRTTGIKHNLDAESQKYPTFESICAGLLMLGVFLDVRVQEIATTYVDEEQ